MPFRLAISHVRRRAGVPTGMRLFLPINGRTTNVVWNRFCLRFRNAWTGAIVGRLGELDVPGFASRCRLEWRS